MATGSDELERELELKRQQLHARANNLRARVAGDVRGVRNQTQDQLSSYVRQAESQVSEHPWLSLAGGFGGGVMLGVTTGSAHKPSAENGRNQEHGGSLLSRGVGALFSTTGGPVFDELRGTLQDTLREMKDTLRESAVDAFHGITGSSNDTSAEHHEGSRDHFAA